MHTQTARGTHVPALGLGTYKLTGQAAYDGVRDALDAGYRHLDTAQMYGNEADVGQALAESGVARPDVFLTTKVWYDRLDPAALVPSVEESLRKLRTEYVDLLLIHWPSDAVPLEATLDAMLEQQAQGRVRHVGVSNFPAGLFERAAAHAPVFCNQVEYHPYLDQSGLRDLARQHEALLAAYRPIAYGRVSKDDVLREIAEVHGKTPVQVTLRWLVQQPGVLALPKAASPEHRRANLDVFDFALSDEEMARIHALARGERLVSPAHAPDWDA